MGDAITIGLFGVTGILIGSIITLLGSFIISNINHKNNLKKLEEEHNKKIIYLKEETFYKKKLTILDKLATDMEEIYRHCFKLIKDPKKYISEENIKLEKDFLNREKKRKIFNHKLYCKDFTIITNYQDIMDIQLKILDNLFKQNKLKTQNKIDKKLIKENEKEIKKMGKIYEKILEKIKKELKP